MNLYFKKHLLLGNCAIIRKASKEVNQQARVHQQRRRKIVGLTNEDKITGKFATLHKTPWKKNQNNQSPFSPRNPMDRIEERKKKCQRELYFSNLPRGVTAHDVQVWVHNMMGALSLNRTAHPVVGARMSPSYK